MCRQLPSTFLCGKRGLWTYESEVSAFSTRRIALCAGGWVQAGGPIHGAAVVGKDLVYFGAYDKKVYAVQPHTWQRERDEL